MSGKKVCLNSPSSYYTGREQSPLHYGLSAEGYEINAIMEGYDKELWIVEVRNNKKVWTKKEYINKMTYEIPLIKEATDDANAANAVDVKDAANAVDVKDAANAANVKDAANAANVKDTTTESSADTIETSVVAETSTDSTKDTSDAKDAPGTPGTPDAKEPKVRPKVSKTMKPTDYTLFITYRIYQMKMESGDNKKNYDCAREEWKEYKKTPDKLKAIMVEATNFQKANSKL
jgi:hypothetical protein